MFDLSGLCALVTGAGRGVGEGIALALAARGASVVVNDIDAVGAERVANAIEDAGGTSIPLVADVTNRSAVDHMMRTAADSIRPVDILVNNAGIPLARFPLAPFRDLDPSTWDDLIRLNLHGVLYCTHSVVGGMCDRGWGRIITISSEAGRVGVGSGVSIYGAAKGGAVAFSRNLSTEVSQFGVTVNCISLSLMEGNWAGNDSDDAPEPRHPRLGKPADAAAAVVYLSSREADWVTGQTLPVNGGFCTS